MSSSESAAVSKCCAVCKKPAPNKCGGCKTTFYCGREHQKAHWKKHSLDCKSYKLVQNEDLGRHYVSTRRIASGEIVIKEDEAIVTGPQQVTVPVCLNCGITLEAEQSKPCDKCGWPLCSSCAEHTGPECSFTKRYKDTKVSIVTGFGIPHPTYKCVSVVRALALRDDNVEAYKKFLTLESKCNAEDSEDHVQTAKFLKRFFNKLDVTEDEIARVAAILQINGHEVPITEPSQIAVYDKSSFIEHSCRANCSKSFTAKGGIVIRAATDIEKGEHISICYTDGLWGTTNRRHHLYRTKFFECKCPRCLDPTEFGTMFDAIKCTKNDCPGFSLPATFAKAEIPDYVCNKCSSSTSSKSVDDSLEIIGCDLATMKKDNADLCRAFIKRHGEKLHENHFYMTDVKLVLAQMIGQQEGGLPILDTDVISEKILLCKKLDELLRVIVPAENRVRGLVLFEMHAAMAEFGRRLEPDQLFGILQETKKVLKETCNLLKYEPDVLPEGRIAKIAKQNLGELEVIIAKFCQTHQSLAPL